MKELGIQNGKYTVLLDDEDYIKVSRYKWYITKGLYGGRRIQRNSSRLNSPRTKISISHDILGVESKIKIIYLDGDIFNNQKSNLFISKCHRIENRKIAKTSIYKGVYWWKARNKWAACIYYEGKQRHLGTYSYEYEAAKAYNNEAIRAFGESAILNQI